MKKQLSVIMVLLIIVFLGFAIVIPVLPTLVDTSNFTIMLSVYSLMGFIMSPVWGRLSDRHGRRPFIMIGTILYSISFLIFGLAGTNLPLMYVSRILGGIASGAVTSTAIAYVADISTDEQRTKSMGLVGMSIGLGFVLGPAFGGILSKINIELPFYLSAVLSFVAFIVAARSLPESLTAEKRVHPANQPSRWTAFQGIVKYLYVISFIVSFTLAGMEGTLFYFEAARFHLDSYLFGIMFLINGLVGAVIQGWFVRKYVKKGTEERYIVIGLLLSAAGFFLLLLSSNIINATIYLSVFGIGNALIQPSVISLITQKTKSGQGVASGLNSSMGSLGRIVGPLFGSSLYYLHRSLPFLIAGIISLLGIVLLGRFVAVDKKMPPKAAI